MIQSISIVEQFLGIGLYRKSQNSSCFFSVSSCPQVSYNCIDVKRSQLPIEKGSQSVLVPNLRTPDIKQLVQHVWYGLGSSLRLSAKSRSGCRVLSAKMSCGYVRNFLERISYPNDTKFPTNVIFGCKYFKISHHELRSM